MSLRVLACAIALAATTCRADGGDARAARRAPASATALDAMSPEAGDPRAPSTSRDASPDAPLDAGAALPPLSGFFEALPVPGHPDAWLSLPTGATDRRPVVVVVHGMGDRPDWQCGGWRRATGEYAFVVCPRGERDAAGSTKDDERYTLRGGAALLAYIDAALEALEVRYPRHADVRTPLLAGFSLGASEVLALAVQDPARFPRIALVEGAARGWTDARIAAYLRGGGKRVLYAAGQRTSETAERATAAHLRARGLDARVVYAPVDHTFAPPLEDAVRTEMPWLVADDPRWRM